MFFPLRDENPLKVIRFQAVTLGLLVVNVLAFLFMQGVLGEVQRQSMYLSFGMVPAVLSGKAVLAEKLEVIPAALTPITYMFLHAGWMHLLGNMAFLWVFADNVEDSFGHGRFLLFYLFCGVAAALAHMVIAPASQLPLVGASGAISGVVASYFLLFPRSKVLSLFGIVPVSLSAMWLLGAWLAYNVLFLLLAQGESGVAFSAHVGGFVAGLAVTWLFRKRIRLRLARGQAAQASQATREAMLEDQAEREMPQAQPATRHDERSQQGPWG